MMEFVCINGDSARFADAKQVRCKVFVEEQGFSLAGELDGRDGDCGHVIGYEDGVPVCTARFFREPDGAFHVGRVAVLPEKRGAGLGLALMDEVFAALRAQGGGEVVLSSQADKAAFYEKAGFVRTGETSVDEGCPHVWMRLRL